MPRPLTLLPRPEPIAVIAVVPDYPPRKFVWRRCHHKIAKAEGPERISPEWWSGRREASRRPRAIITGWRTKTASASGSTGSAFTTRHEEQRWFLHGLFSHERAYAELVAASNFSFLRGASRPEELAVAAGALGYEALAICDRNTLAGVVRAHKPAKQLGLHYIPGCRLVLQDEPSRSARRPGHEPGANGLTARNNIVEMRVGPGSAWRPTGTTQRAKPARSGTQD